MAGLVVIHRLRIQRGSSPLDASQLREDPLVRVESNLLRRQPGSPSAGQSAPLPPRLTLGGGQIHSANRRTLSCDTPLYHPPWRFSRPHFWTPRSTRLAQRPTMLSSTRPCIPPASRNDQPRAVAGQTLQTGRLTHREGLRWPPVNSSHCAQTAKQTLRLRTGTTGTATIAAPFPDPPAVPAIPVARAKGPENIQTDSHAPSGRVGGCLAHHWWQWSAIGADPWVVSVLRDGYRIPLADLPPPLATSPARFGAGSLTPHRDRHHGYERSAGDSPRPGPRLLQPPLPSGKSFRRLAPRNRLLSTERVRPTDPVQNGNSKFRPSNSQKEWLPSLDRPQERLLPDSSTSLFQKAPSLRLERHGLPVQGTMFRSVDRPTGIHESVRGGVFMGSRSGNPPATIPGRLADLVRFTEQDETTRRPTPVTLPLAGHSNKHGEVRPLPVQVRRIPRHGHRHSVCPSIPYRGPSREIPLLGKEVPCPTEPPGLTVASTVGPHVIAGETGTPHETSDALPPVSAEVRLVHRDRPSAPPGTSVPAGGHRCLLVDVEGPSPPGGALRGTPPELHLYSDASRSGWGAHLLDRSASGLWSDQETLFHINILEIKALFLTLQAFQDVVTNQRVTAMCDNSTVVAYVCKQGGTVLDSLCELTGQLLRWTEDHNMLLEARYLPGQSNVLADLLSRRNQVLAAEWSLLPQVARKVIRTWASSTIDLFATHLNAKLSLYCSLIPDPQAVFEDAFRHPWNHLDVYAFPAFGLVDRVVARVTPNLSMTLITPLWPEKAWFADLLLLLTQPPLALPLWDRLLCQPHFHRFHGGDCALNLHAWRLSSVSSESQAFQDRLRACCPYVSESPLPACTNRNGSHSVVGVVDGALLQSTPLYPW